MPKAGFSFLGVFPDRSRVFGKTAAPRPATGHLAPSIWPVVGSPE
jgi:hypothetical protein